MQFRPVKSSLADAMKEKADFNDRAGFIRCCKEAYRKIYFFNDWELDPELIAVKPYIDEPDERIGWERTYLVTYNGRRRNEKFVLGYSDSPMPKE